MINLKEIEFKILLWMQYCRLWVHSTAASWRKNNKPWKGAKGENEGRWWTSLRLALSFSRDKWLAVEKRFRLASSLNSLVLRRGDDRRRRSYEDSTLSFFSTLSLSLYLSLSVSFYSFPPLRTFYIAFGCGWSMMTWIVQYWNWRQLFRSRKRSGFFSLKLSFIYFLRLILFFSISFFIFRYVFVRRKDC